jgi:hypothetical protein
MVVPLSGGAVSPASVDSVLNGRFNTASKGRRWKARSLSFSLVARAPSDLIHTWARGVGDVIAANDERQTPSVGKV